MHSTVLFRPKSLQKQIVRILTNRIYTGEYAPGEKFPSENQLASEFSVSRASVRSAMAALEAKGLIIRHQGVGSFVRQASISNPLDEFIDFKTLIEINGFTPSVKIHNVYLTEACHEQAQDIEVAEGSPIIKIETVFSADGTPVIYAVNTIPEWVLGKELEDRLIQSPEICEPFIYFMNNYCNQEIAYNHASLWADTVRHFDMDIHEFDANISILVVNSIGYNPDNRPIFKSLTAYPDKRVKFKIERR